jgi:rhodanese-related sulfurtransferase
MIRYRVFLILLVFALLAAGCGQQATPEPTPVPPTATPVPPTATPVPPTATPVPPTATPVPPTPTPVPPTPTPEPEPESGVLDDAMAYFGPGVKFISADALFENLNDGDASNDPFIISVRAPEHDAVGQIPGAYNVSLKELMSPEVLATLPTDKQIVVACYTGQTASQGVAALNMAGFDAAALTYGMSGWTTDPAVYVNRFNPETTPRQYPTFTDAPEWGDETVALPQPLAETSAEAAYAYLGPNGAKMISADALFENLNDGDESNDPLIISVRAAEDYAKGHLPGALWAAPKDLFTPEMLAKLPTDRQIVVYCYTGQNSAHVVAGLNMLGYDATSLTYGMSGWTDDPEVYVRRFNPETTPRDYPTEAAAVRSLVSGAGGEVAMAAEAYFSGGPKTITADALFEILNDGDASNDPTIISVRKPEDFAAGHLAGAINLTHAQLFDAATLATIPQDKPVVVYCYTGQTASQAVSVLNMLGYDARNLVFGMSGWTTDPDVYVNRFDPTKANDFRTTTDGFEADGEYDLPEPLAATVVDAANAYFDVGLKTIQAPALYENLNDGDESNDPYIISVRSQEHYGQGHLPGAVWYDPKTLFTAASLSTLPNDRPIVVYCYTGQTASQVVPVLNMLGYDASNLVYGIGNWTNDPDVYVNRFNPETTPRDYPVVKGQ